MASKPKKAVDMNDPKTFSQPGAFDAIRTLAEQNGWTSGFGVAMTAAHFEPRMPNTVAAADIERAKADIVARGLAQKGAKQAEAKKEANGGRERFPFNEAPDEAQEWWDKGRWSKLKFGAYMTLSGLRNRFKAEIAAGKTISKAQVDEYHHELEVEKEKIVQLLDEQSDPDATGQELCEAPDGFHSGERKFQMTEQFKLEWAADGTVHRQVHKGGNEPIKVGNVLVVESEEPDVDPVAVIYCPDCRQKVRRNIKEAKEALPGLLEALEKAKKTGDEKEVVRLKAEVKKAEDWASIRARFYTLANAQRKLDAIKRNVEGGATALDQLKGASKRPTGAQFGLGTKKLGKADWRTARRSR